MSLTTRSLAPSLAALALVLLSACGSDGSDDGDDGDDDTIPGGDVAAAAEKALANDQPGLAEGSFECPEVEAEEGATVTCTRTAYPEGGLYVTLTGEVEVTKTDGSDFSIHLQMADQAESFGTTGDHLEEELTPQVEARLGAAPSEVDCPDLPGEVGAKVTCEVTVDDEDTPIEVTVDQIDETNLSMNYTFAEAGS